MLRFGSGDTIKLLHKIIASDFIGHQAILSENDEVDIHVPMLMSKLAMKKANTSIDFQTDTVIIQC